MAGIELPRAVSIENLPTGDIINLIGKQNRETAFQTLTLLYCRKPDVSTFLRTTYGFTPEAFTKIVTQNMSILFNSLPKEYGIDPAVYLDTNPSALAISCDIVSQEVLRKSYKWHQEEIKENPAVNDYSAFRKQRDSAYMTYGMEMRIAGFFGFELFRENIRGYVFDNLFSMGTELKLAYNITLDRKNLKKYLPVPLRRKDGSLLNISDKIREAEEGIIATISSPQNHIGLAMTTMPSADGKVMLDRQGFRSSELLSEEFGELWPHFQKTKAYDMRDSGCRYKIIHLPFVGTR